MLVDENVDIRAARELADCAGAVPWVEAGVFGAGELVVLDESIDESLRGCDMVKARIEFVIVGNGDAAASAAGEDARAARVGCEFVCGDDCLHDVVSLLVVRLIGIVPDHPPWEERVNLEDGRLFVGRDGHHDAGCGVVGFVVKGDGESDGVAGLADGEGDVGGGEPVLDCVVGD